VAFAAAVGAATVWAGVQYWRADAGLAAAARVDSPAQYRRAADLFAWEPFYSLEAGGRVWRAGLQDGAPSEVRDGRALIERALSRDKTSPLGYADLARLAIARGEPQQGVEQLKRGLEWSPDHPVLQGLWGYAALFAVDQLKDKTLGRELASGLERLPVTTPDGWYWLSEVRRALDDAEGAAQARVEAARLAPKLTPHRYGQRLLAGG
jgi:tetratricopeptide (TPR) repeat protein